MAMAAGLPVGLAERDFWPSSRGKSGSQVVTAHQVQTPAAAGLQYRHPNQRHIHRDRIKSKELAAFNARGPGN
jgi:hypothetical protein